MNFGRAGVFKALNAAKGGGDRMKKGIKAALSVVYALIALLLLAVHPQISSQKQVPNTPPPASISILYREADSVLLATCMRLTGDEEEPLAARFCVDKVLDGAAEEGDVITLPLEASAGVRYLLYLRNTENGQELVTEAPIPVDSGSVVYGNEIVSIESIAEDMERQRRIIPIPSGSYFYGSLETLAPACDEIVIARVLSASGPVDTVCRSVKKGESTLSTFGVVFVRLKVENGFYGSLSYGDKLDVVITPYNAIPVTNATDLTPMTADAPPMLTPEVGSAYIFFLKKGGDSKTPRYFPINPYEGCVMLVGSSVIHPYYNDALKGVDDLAGFSERLRELMRPVPDETPEP